MGTESGEDVRQRTRAIHVLTAVQAPIARFATSSAVYTVAGVVQRGLPILLLPLYASALSPDAYGQVAIVVAATAVLGSLMSLGLEASVVRESVRLRDDYEGRHRFLNTIGLFTLAAPVVAAIAVWAFITSMGGIGLGADVVLLGVMAAALQTSMTVFVGAALRADERVRAYLAMTLVQAGTTAGLTLWFVVGMAAGPFGWFAGALLASAISLAFGLMVLGHRWSTDVSAATLRAALAFGLPLLPHALSHWVLNLSDRIVLGAFVDDAQVGVYNLAYQAAAPISLVLVALNQGIMPLYARAADNEQLRRDLGRLATIHVHLVSWLGMSAILLAPPVILALFPATYAGAAGLVPWIAVGYVLFGLYLVPMNSLSLMIGRTRWLWVPTLIAAIANVALNVLFVPRYGATASAIVTAITYGLLFVGVVVVRTRTSGPRIDYRVGQMAVGVGWVMFIGLLTLAAVSSLDDVGALILRVSAVVVGGVGLLYLSKRTGARAQAKVPQERRAPEATSPDDLIRATPNG